MTDFQLSLSFSLYNKAIVLETKENLIRFGIVEKDDEELKEKLKKSAFAFLNEQNIEGKIFIDEENCCLFEQISLDSLRHEISLRYAVSDTEEKNGGDAVMLLDTLLSEAGKKGATDIHIEEKCVRFRRYGQMEEVCELSPEKNRELVRRIKVLANLNVLESRMAQDGQFTFSGDDQIFVRVSCIPSLTAKGSAESLVLRLLNVTKLPLTFEELGFDREQCKKIREVAKSEQGLILIAGATGSGKSTTAASLIREICEIHRERKKIITIEDPPEYLLDGVTQIHVDEDKGMSFAQSLRYVFRQDPDVIFVGEIRDEESARTVLQASLTGHLVIATVHAGGIMESSARMKELGVNFEEYSSVLQALIYQRLKLNEKNRTMELEARLLCKEKVSSEGDFFAAKKTFNAVPNIFPIQKRGNESGKREKFL